MRGCAPTFFSFLFFSFSMCPEKPRMCLCRQNIQGCCDTHQEFLFACYREKPDTTKFFVIDSRIKPKTDKRSSTEVFRKYPNRKVYRTGAEARQGCLALELSHTPRCLFLVHFLSTKKKLVSIFYPIYN